MCPPQDKFLDPPLKAAVAKNGFVYPNLYNIYSLIKRFQLKSNKDLEHKTDYFFSSLFLPQRIFS